jgi:DNA-binding transcriptional regulator YdaS (Cro superfamily)
MVMSQAQNPLVLEAIGLCGSEAKLAAATKFSQPAIHKAKNAPRVSAEMAIRIDAATGGRVPRWKLRPDLGPAPRVRKSA